ncbi:hypothetical protein CWI42_081200 [Ordospora colligata]|uniref:EF-hand domain-containing protein n=1 Tax=Ordospora colligata OC4 TaxID=1354746 RepID=A0A0B2UJI0_9MICR|nr:uncharacterized protein M896_081200 [Ordospora colligata OC4]KHN69384.1 hypothetical protein M896_081200 [Ordospora colligata OC4]TBU14898.1 hypothetical protein CWI41_081190 [Ordospora colligata]TBU15029.1 hypothetical protein CWI40_081210 [Ordospora colligata]TBU18283.1 hypothetical protein CWI42_081200 [Ordospora colligata]
MNREKMLDQWKMFGGKDLTNEATLDLLRLCGYAPQEMSVPIPRSFEEFEEVASSVRPSMQREQMRRMISQFNHRTHFTKQDMMKYLGMGDRLSEEEMREFLKVFSFDRNDEATIDELVEFLYASD